MRAQKQRPPRGADGDSDDSEDDELGAGPGAMVEADPPLVGIELPPEPAVWGKVLDALKDIQPPPRHPGPDVQARFKPEPGGHPSAIMPPGVQHDRGAPPGYVSL